MHGAACNHPGMQARLRALSMAGALTITLLSHSASADPPEPNGPEWAFGAPAGEAILGTACLLSLATYFMPQRITEWGAYSSRPRDDVAGGISDYTGAFMGSVLQILGGYATEAVYYDQNQARVPLERAFRTSLVDLEAMTLSSGLTLGIKRIAGRCRPRSWKDGRCGPKAAENDAFPSGHTSPIAAIAGARLALALRSEGDDAPRWAAFGFAEGATILTGALRVAAGAHSWEDVVGGFVLGNSVGILVAVTHRLVPVPVHSAPTGSTPGSQPVSLFTWSGQF